MATVQKIVDVLNVKKRCEVYRVGLWQCPHFLFLVMGAVIAFTIITAYVVGQKYADPYLLVFIITGVTIVFLSLSYILLNSFERIAIASKEKSDFISIMSHQLRNPLASIKWQLDLLLHGKEEPVLTSEEKEYRNALTAIGEQNERMLQLINELLEVNRLESGTLVLRPINFNLAETVRKSVGKYVDRASASNIELVYFPPQKDLKVSADEVKIGDAVGHLLDNAMIYSPAGTKIRVTLEEIKGYGRCSVEDEGSGISSEDSKKIFKKKFFRGESPTKQSPGLGVGLYVAKTITEASGGKIGFTSALGRGSTFWIDLPIVA